MKKFYLNDEEVKEEVFYSKLEDTVNNYCQDSYDDFLDECYGDFEIGYSRLNASDILKNCDPVAYRCGLSDYENCIYEDFKYDLENGEEIKVNGDYFRIEEEEEEEKKENEK